MLNPSPFPDVEAATPSVNFSNRWYLLGPFRIGTREAIWGANPLETSSANFYNVPVDDEVDYHSPLAANGVVKWSGLDSVRIERDDDHTHPGQITIQLQVDFQTIDWDFQQSVYGWAALQYQAFASGHINVPGDSCLRVLLNVDGILEYAINAKPSFGGDFYGFHRAPHALELSPGKNRIDLRLFRDVRAMGGLGWPFMFPRVTVQPSTGSLHISAGSHILPDIINERLVSHFGSVTVRNESSLWLKVTAVQFSNFDFCVKLLNALPVTLAPGQSRPLGLCVEYLRPNHGGSRSGVLTLISDHPEITPALCELKFKHAHMHSPHKITFLHPSGSVSYAILRAPICGSSQRALPVLLCLHGAGVEADSSQVRHTLDDATDLAAWALFPTGMSPWCGDDWHVWGIADVTAAVSAIVEWIEAVHWLGPGIDVESWLVVGHSNGGQGAWFLATHHPEKVIAVASASGYSSIQNYVPYSMWREANPLADLVIQNSLSSYRHELLMPNLTGTPIYQQHGGKDDNVPPFHSRLLNVLLHESGSNPKYIELPKKGHWFEGVMTTKGFLDFYHSILDSGSRVTRPIPANFDFVVPNSGDVGSRAGIFVDQLESPDSLGKLSVEIDVKGVWFISTVNIYRLHFAFATTMSKPCYLVIDNQEIHLPAEGGRPHHLALNGPQESWTVCDPDNWKSLSTRYGRQRGGLDAILRTLAPFRIQSCSQQSFDVALQTSRNLVQYYGADSELLSPGLLCTGQAKGNVFTCVIASPVPPCSLSEFPVQIKQTFIDFTRKRKKGLRKIMTRPGMGMALLRPLADENLELVLWGSDERGLRQAARMAPSLTGAGQPDFVLFGDEARWKGHAGVLAMGFFDHSWQISQASYLP